MKPQKFNCVMLGELSSPGTYPATKIAKRTNTEYLAGNFIYGYCPVIW